MGTTPKGYPYPEGTDLVMDGDDAIQALAEAVDAKSTYGIAAGTVQVTGITVGNAQSVTVTFPAGRFTNDVYITIGMYTSTPAQRWAAHANKSPTSVQIVGAYTGQSSSISLWISWAAVQVDPPTELLAARAAGTSSDDGLRTDPDNATATCPTAGCSNQGIPIPIATNWTDEEGVTHQVSGVVCGVCGADISADVAPIDGA